MKLNNSIVFLESKLIDLILKKETTKKEIVKPYFDFMIKIFSAKAKNYNLQKVNDAIVKKWSLSALVDIKIKVNKYIKEVLVS